MKSKVKDLLGACLLLVANFVQAQGAPFTCDSTAYSIATGQLAVAIYDASSGIVAAEASVGTPWSSNVAPALNSLGYNYQDNYLYAVARSENGRGTQQLIRIGSAGAGAGVVVANISGLNPASPNLLTAAAVVVETPAGPRFYIAGENGAAPYSTQLYEINLTTGAATTIGAPIPFRVFDIAVRPTDRKVLFVASSQAVPDFTIYQWDTNTGLTAPYARYTGPAPSNAGGIVFSRDGRFMLIRDLNNLNWLTIDMAAGTSRLGASIPDTPEHDAASCTPQTTNLGLAKTNPASFVVGVPGNYTLTVNNSADAVTSPASVTVNDHLPPNFAYNSAAPGAGVTAASCVATGSQTSGLDLVCTLSTPAGIPAGGSAAFTVNVTPLPAAAGVPSVNKAALHPSGGLPPATVPDACVSTGVPAGCAIAPPITPTAALGADMSVALGASTPTVVRPGQTFAGLTLVCSNGAGAGAATAATCVPSASAGTVGNVVCSPPSGGIVAPGASISCSFDFAAPGLQGGADEASTSVTFTATTGAANDSNAANNVATLVATLIDAVTDNDTKPGGSAAQTTNLAANDQFPAGSVFTSSPGGTCVNSGISAAGIANYDVVASGNCTLNYQVCAPAPNASTCDIATLTVTSAAADLRPQFRNLPTLSAPGTTVNASIVCTNDGPGAASNASCTATALDSRGTPVAITLGACTATGGSAASLPAREALICAISYVTPGSAGGSDTAPVAVTLTGTTGASNDANGGTGAGGNNSVVAAVGIVDAVDDAFAGPPGSIGLTSNLALNDQVPAASIFSIRPGGTCASASVSGAGQATFNVPAATLSCVVNYQVCAPAPSASVCDNATLTVTSAPTVSDMVPVLNGLPAVSAPGAGVSGNLVCRNIGLASATSATCTATAIDSNGAPVAVAVGPCVASSTSAASLAPGASLTCPFQYTTPGTPGGGDTVPTAVTVTGVTGATNDNNGRNSNGGNNSTAVTVAVIDAVNDSANLPFGTAGTVNLVLNDNLGGAAAAPGSSGNVTLTPVDPLPAGITLDSATGLLNIAAGTPAGSYPINYQICARPAQSPVACDTATVTVAVLGKIDVVKAVGVPLQVGPNRFELPYVVVVGNAAPAGGAVFNVQADENLVATFGPAATLGIKAGSYSVVASGGTCSANPAFNGVGNTRLLAGTDDLSGGQRCTIRFTVSVAFAAGPLPGAPFNNSAFASSVASDATPNPGYTFPGGTPTPPSVASTTDVSSTGATPPSGSPPGTPPAAPALPASPGADTPAPTPVTLIAQQLGVAKRVVGLVQSGPSAFSVSYEIIVANVGGVPVTNVQVADNVAATFAPPAQLTSLGGLSNVARAGAASAAQCAVNPAHGLANANLMTGQTSLDPGQSCSFRFSVGFATGGATGPFNNTAIASSYTNPATTPGATPAGPPLATDLSDSGSNPIGNNPGAPGDTGGSDDPTPLALPGSVSGSVWYDASSASGGNRIREPGEPGLPGYTAELIYPAGTVVGGVSLSGQTVLTTAGVPATSTTDVSGNYTIVGVPPGNYQVRFRAPGASGGSGPVIGVPVNGENNNPQANSSLDLPTRTLLISMLAGANLAQQSLPVDPSGVVYDSTSRLPVGGTRLELLAPSGTPLPAACLLLGQQGQLTPATGLSAGMYRFDLLLGADPACPAAVTAYTVRVTAPAAYANPPSRVIPPSAPLPSQSGATYAVVPQATAPAQGQPTTYHLVISLGAASALVIHNHIPLDPNVVADLVLTKTADKTNVTVGDSVLYRIRISNPGPGAAPSVRVVDDLPLGFKMISGSATLQLGAAAPTPIADSAITGFPGPKLRFNIGVMAANTEAVISYRVRLGTGADRGTGVNSAQIEGTTRVVRAQAAIKVTGSVFSADACVIGKVYVDCNQNKVQDNGEPGIPGVRLYMEDGTSVTTDENGQYSLCGVRPITHVLKIDPQSAPVGARFGITSSRNAGDAESLFVDLKNGELHRADFREQSCFPKVLEQVSQRRRLGPVFVPHKQDGRDDPWGIQFNSEQHKLERTPAANPANPAVGGGR